MEKINEALSKYNRLFGILAGVFIILVSLIAVIFGYLTGGLGELTELYYFFLGLDLLAVYWIITGLKPELTVSSLLSERTDASKNQIVTLMISLFTLLFWTMMLTSDQGIIDKLFLLAITSPAFIFTYHEWIGINRFKELEEELEEMDEME